MKATQVAPLVIHVQQRDWVNAPLPRREFPAVQVRALARSTIPSGDVFPTSLGEEPMIAAGDQRSAIFQGDAKRLLQRLPMCKHGACARTACTCHAGPSRRPRRAKLGRRPASESWPSPTQDRRSSGHAVGTSMKASPVRVDAPAEAHVGAVVVGEDLAGVVLVDLQLGGRDLLEVFPPRWRARGLGGFESGRGTIREACT